MRRYPPFWKSGVAPRVTARSSEPSASPPTLIHSASSPPCTSPYVDSHPPFPTHDLIQRHAPPIALHHQPPKPHPIASLLLLLIPPSPHPPMSRDSNSYELRPLPSPSHDFSRDNQDEAEDLLRRASVDSVQSFELYTPDEDKQVLKKLDRRLVAFMALLYCLSFLDRSSE